LIRRSVQYQKGEGSNIHTRALESDEVVLRGVQEDGTEYKKGVGEER
jgi:hypothetical protein